MQRRGVLAVALLPLSWLFRAVAAARRQLYRWGVLRTERVGVPVVIVGNIGVGGSGKTPLVLWLAARLRERGFAPGIVSRGYGGSAQVPRAVAADDAAGVVGDEPLLLARRSGCPVWIGRQRVAAARALLGAHPECDVLIADDGLQHYALARDFEIVVMDERGLGNGWFVPAGPLREGPWRLQSVDALVVNGDSAPAAALGMAPGRRFSMQLRGERFQRLDEPLDACAAEDLRGRRLHAVAGIGHPQRFFDHLTRLGLHFVAHPFPDHHRFVARDLSFSGGEALLMTEKDGVKCAGLAPPETWVLRVDAQVAADPAAQGQPDLVDLVVEKIDGRAPA